LRELKLRDSGDKMFLEHLHRTDVTSSFEAIHTLRTSIAQRITAATKGNDVSSRSHAFFVLTVEQRGLRSKLTFVDLAGSEPSSGDKNVGINERYNLLLLML
jgi:hypothetical protein